MKKGILLLLAGLVMVAGYRLFAWKPNFKNPAPRGETIVCFGDSLTFGTGASPEMSYPAQLSRLLERPVINAGIPGDTTADGLHRLERDVLAHSPRLVLITLGGNDLKNGVAKKIAFSNLATIIDRIQATGALAVVGGLDIPYWDRGFSQGYEDVCRETESLLLPDILGGIMGKPDLMSDRIHPNGAGYTRLAKKFHRAIEPYL